MKANGKSSTPGSRPLGRSLFIPHTCGDVYAILDDLVDLDIHAKYGFEDKILPVEKVYRRWNRGHFGE